MTDTALELLLKLYTDRANWYGKQYPNYYTEASCYGNALDMLVMAINNDIEGLRQFDYFGENFDETEHRLW